MIFIIKKVLTKKIGPDSLALSSCSMEIATLFEQSILLISQVFNAITYHRRLNILNTLIDNSIKVKGILKEPSLDLNYIENPHLF